MLITYGIHDFSTVRYDLTTYVEKSQFVKLSTNVLPPFVVLSSNSGATATMNLLDENGDSVQSGISLTVTDNEDAKQINYAGTTLADNVCGYYQVEIVHGANHYYSEFFEWSDDVSDYSKITINPYKILVNNYYTIDLSSLQFIIYLNQPISFNGRVIKLGGETNEEGISKNYGEELLRSTINFEHEIELVGNDAVFKLLSMIRPSTISGTSLFEFNGRSKSMYNTTVEQIENSNFGEKIIIKLKFREATFISNSNE